MSPEEAAAYATTLGVSSAAYAELLEGIPLDTMLEMHERADTLGPILDPTRYRASLYDGTRDASKRLIEAAIAFRSSFRAAVAAVRR